MRYTLTIEPGAAPRQIAAATHLLTTLAKEMQPEADEAPGVFIQVPPFQRRIVNVTMPDGFSPSMAFWLRDDSGSMGFSEEFWFGTTTEQGTPVYSTEGGPDEPAFWLPEGA